MTLFKDLLTLGLAFAAKMYLKKGASFEESNFKTHLDIV